MNELFPAENFNYSPADIHLQFASFFDEPSLAPYAYLVSKKLEEGHICLSLDDMTKEADTLPRKDWVKYLSDVNGIVNETFVSTDPTQKRPFIVHDQRLYLQRYFHYETVILQRILAFLKDEMPKEADRIDKLKAQKDLLQKLFTPGEGKAGNEKTDWQLTAAITGALNNFTIITGGPGTGKTTTVAKILALLFNLNPKLRVALAAPTGKAAARMAESLKYAVKPDETTQSSPLPIDESIGALFKKLEPSTIHRLLGSIPESCHFRHNRENPLRYDLVIVDESSMIDVALFAKLLDAIGEKTALILLGDRNQLASVEAGSLFADLCNAQSRLNLLSPQRADFINSFIQTKDRQVKAENIVVANHSLFDHVVELEHSHRFSDEKGIGRFSKAIIQNKEAVIKSFFEGNDEQVSIDTNYSKEIFEEFIGGYEAFIREKDLQAALRELNKLRVLCAIREGEQGLYALNRQIEASLHRRGLIQKSGDFYVNRPVIITSNLYNLELFNGDIGIVRRDSKGVLRAWFEDMNGNIKPVLPAYINQAETVFAMTIHKSQGSEFNKVLTVLPNKVDLPLLTRELLYTAVTRARESVIIQGSKEVILAAAADCVKRSSGIIERFNKVN